MKLTGPGLSNFMQGCEVDFGVMDGGLAALVSEQAADNQERRTLSEQFRRGRMPQQVRAS